MCLLLRSVGLGESGAPQSAQGRPTLHSVRGAAAATGDSGGGGARWSVDCQVRRGQPAARRHYPSEFHVCVYLKLINCCGGVTERGKIHSKYKRGRGGE